MSTGLIIFLSVCGVAFIIWGIKTKNLTKILIGISSFLSSVVLKLTKKTKEQKEEIKKKDKQIEIQQNVVKTSNEIEEEITEKKQEIKTDEKEKIQEVLHEQTEKGQITISNNIIDSFNSRLQKRSN